MVGHNPRRGRANQGPTKQDDEHLLHMYIPPSFAARGACKLRALRVVSQGNQLRFARICCQQAARSRSSSSSSSFCSVFSLFCFYPPVAVDSVCRTSGGHAPQKQTTDTRCGTTVLLSYLNPRPTQRVSHIRRSAEMQRVERCCPPSHSCSRDARQVHPRSLLTHEADRGSGRLASGRPSTLLPAVGAVLLLRHRRGHGWG